MSNSLIMTVNQINDREHLQQWDITKRGTAVLNGCPQHSTRHSLFFLGRVVRAGAGVMALGCRCSPQHGSPPLNQTHPSLPGAFVSA